jgi:hypothetical protein
MSTRFPPRYLPTLTEVVTPQVRDVFLPVAAPVAPAAPAVPAVPTEPAMPVAQEVQPKDATLADRDMLAQQVIKLITPQLEAELRNVAQELFEAQYSALLPSLYLQIEVAVRDAIDLALSAPVDNKD